MSVLIIGGGICGLGAALLLARDGHDVMLLERDVATPPSTASEAWDHWPRTGVAQFRQPHNFMPGLRLLLEAELPDVQDGLRRAGAGTFDLLNPLPNFWTDRSPRPIDHKLWTLTARRPVGEWVFGLAAEQEPRVRIRRGEPIVEEFHWRTELEITPWYDAQIAMDRARFAEMEALREGRRPAEPGDELTKNIYAVFMTMGMDPDLYRAAIEDVGTITSVQEILRRPDVQQRIRAAQEAMKDRPPVQMPGPNREQLLELVR